MRGQLAIPERADERGSPPRACRGARWPTAIAAPGCARSGARRCRGPRKKPARKQVGSRRRRLRDEGRMHAQDRARDTGADRHPVGLARDPAEDGPDERALTLAVDPRVEVVRDRARSRSPLPRPVGRSGRARRGGTPRSTARNRFGPPSVGCLPASGRVETRRRYPGAAVPHLRRSDRSRPGLTRRGRGRGFEYRDDKGEHVDAATRARVEALSVLPPPGRTSGSALTRHRAHSGHRARRTRPAAVPLPRCVAGSARRGQARPRARLRLRAAGRARERMARRSVHPRGLTRLRVLACAVRLLDLGFFRIGGEQSAEREPVLRSGDPAARIT